MDTADVTSSSDPNGAIVKDSQNTCCEDPSPELNVAELSIVDKPAVTMSIDSAQSNEVEDMTLKPPLIIIESDSCSGNGITDSAITISDASLEKESSEKLSLMKRKATCQLLPSTKIRLIDSVDTNSSTDISPDAQTENVITAPTILKHEIPQTKIKQINISKRRMSCESQYVDTIKQHSEKKLRRSLSTETFLKFDTDKIQSESLIIPSFDNQNAFNSSNKNSQFPIIHEENSSKVFSESQNVNDSQNIVLQFLPSESTEKGDSQIDRLSIDQVNTDTLNPSQKSLSGISVSTDASQDTTESINMDSPINHETVKSELKNKPFSNLPYTASTPELTSISKIHRFQLSKNMHISDNDSDNTPPFRDYKITAKISLPSKLNSSTNLNNNNSPLSPLSNGHSDGSRLNNLSNLHGPSFDVQINCDENNEFLALHVVKIDNEIGSDISRECQKIHKKVYRDYTADVSKTNSQSSVTSGGLLQLPLLTKTSFLSTSSSNSSTRTSDNTFVIPQRPGRSLSSQNLFTVKGLNALKQKIDEVIMHLIEAYGTDSLYHSSGGSLVNSFDLKKNISNGNHTDHNENVRNMTPRSSKKKLPTKARRTLNRKSKKDILPITKEEGHLDNEIHSPEMINTDPNRCQRPSTPLTNKKEENIFFNNNNIVHSKQSSPTAITSPKRNVSPVSKNDNNYPENTVVLAKWRDKKYYPGKIKKSLEGNKYLIEFYDGATKILLDDFIIFGNTKELPILGQSIYAIIEDEIYEPSLVLSLINVDGTTRYRCTTDRDITVLVKASDIYVTEDQAKSIRENCQVKSPHSTPSTPRKRINRDLNLDNIIDGPRIPRNRDKSGFPKKDTLSPSSRASTSGISKKLLAHKESVALFPKQRQESESSEGGECSTRAPSTCLEEVSGVQPEIQKTPRKIDGIKAGALLIKGTSKQNVGKRCSKVTKFENDHDTNNYLGPIPSTGSSLFKDLHFLLTCTNPPNSRPIQKKNIKSNSPICWNDDSQNNTSSSTTEKEDIVFTTIPFHKERLKEQLESGGGIVYSYFEDVPKNIYGVCKLIAPRPCLTAKYIQCLAANIQPLSHIWVVRSCISDELKNMDEDALPTGWSIEKNRFINWEVSSSDRRSSTPFKNNLILLCSDNETFIKFWRRVCTLAGGDTRTVNEEDLNLSGGLVIVTEYDCPHEVQNKANQDNIPLVSTIWVTQCLIEGTICDHNASVKYNFTYTDID